MALPKLAAPLRQPRMIRTCYSGGHDERTSASCTLEGAIRAVVTRLLAGEYTNARIYDLRYGDSKVHAVLIHKLPNSITIRWTDPKMFRGSLRRVK